jgi:hypothetical protein
MKMQEYTQDEGMTTVKVGSVRLFGASITWRETKGPESWYCKAVLAGDIPAEPKGECEGGNCRRRRPCSYCWDYQDWSENITNCVAQITGWGLYSWYSGPGRGFADEPFVNTRGSRVYVSWSGGLDI